MLDPSVRWFPAPEDQRTTAYEKLLPPLVAHVRDGVKAWRDSGYAKASDTSRALLAWWFDTEHLVEQADRTRTLFR
jgi:type III restriction enzyme